VSLSLSRPRVITERGCSPRRGHAVASRWSGRPEYKSPWWVNHGRRPTVLGPLAQPSETRPPFSATVPSPQRCGHLDHNQS
jgi:hypothetical protein